MSEEQPNAAVLSEDEQPQSKVEVNDKYEEEKQTDEEAENAEIPLSGESVSD